MTHQDAPAAQRDVEPGTEIVLPDEAADHPGVLASTRCCSRRRCGNWLPPSRLTSPDVSTARLSAGVGGDDPGVRPESDTGPAATSIWSSKGPAVTGAASSSPTTRELPTAELTGIELRPVDPAAVPLPLEQKIFDTVWVQSSAPPIAAGDRCPPAAGWCWLTPTPRQQALAAEFAARFSSPTRRVISDELSDESAVLEAFAKTAADPNFRPSGVVVLRRRRLRSTAPTPTPRLAVRSDLIWDISAAAHAASTAGRGIRRGCGW